MPLAVWVPSQSGYSMIVHVRAAAGELQPETRVGSHTQNVPLLLIALAGFKQHRSLMKQRDRPGSLKLKKLLLLVLPAGSYLLSLQCKAVLEQHTNPYLHWLSWKYLSLAFPTKESFLKMRAPRIWIKLYTKLKQLQALQTAEMVALNSGACYNSFLCHNTIMSSN